VVIPLLQETNASEMIPMVESDEAGYSFLRSGMLWQATLEKLQEREATTAAEKVDRLMNQYRARGLASGRAARDARSPGQRTSRRTADQRRDRGQPSRAGDVEAILAPEIPIPAEEQKAKNRDKRPCPICW